MTDLEKLELILRRIAAQRRQAHEREQAHLNLDEQALLNEIADELALTTKSA